MDDLNQRLSVVASALSTDARVAAHAARTLGFAGIQFDATSAALDLTTLSGTGRREFRHVLSSFNLQLVGLRFELGPRGFGPASNVERVLEQLERTLETAAGLAAPLVCVDLGPLPPAPPGPPKPVPKVTQDMAGLIILPNLPAEGEAPAAPQELSAADRALASHVDAALAEVCARADRYSVIIAVRSELAGFAALDAVIRRASCPWMGIELDPVSALRDPWPLDEILSRLAPLVRHVRVRDASVGDAHRTRPALVGQGSVNWGELLASLDAAGYRGWLTVDPMELPDRAAAAATARKTLLAVVQQ